MHNKRAGEEQKHSAERQQRVVVHSSLCDGEERSSSDCVTVALVVELEFLIRSLDVVLITARKSTTHTNKSEQTE